MRICKFLILMSVILTIGCASQQDALILRDRIVALEQRNMDLQQRTLASDKDKEQIRSRLEEKDMAIRSQSAGLQASLDKINSDIQSLSGKIDETAYAVNQKINALEETEKRKEERLARLEQRSGMGAESARPAMPPSGSGDSDTPSSAPRPPVSKTSPAAGAPDKTSLSEEELYNFAKEALDKGDYEAARDGFQKMLKAHPKSKWADSAQFWIGDSYYRQKWYEKAILEYQSVIEKYPKGNKVKSALLKQGLSFIEIGDKANGRLILQELIQKFPNSDEARTAKQKLK